MLNIALTGNVAAGKSEVTRLLEDWGAAVIDADLLVRRLQEPGEPVYDAIVARFGRDVVSADGTLDRPALRRLILANRTHREALNAIVHPAVAAARDDAVRAIRNRGAPLIINDIPLLFEVLDPDDFDGVLLVDAPTSIRRQRLIQHRGLAPSEADRLIAAQIPSAEKRTRADWVVDNVGSLEDLEGTLRPVWAAIQARGRAGTAPDQPA